MADNEVKCDISYNASLKKSYLWFTGTPPTQAVLFLRKDGWTYNDRSKKWEYKQLGEASFRHAQRVQRRFSGLYKMNTANDVHYSDNDVTQVNPVIYSYIFEDRENKHVYIYFSQEPSVEIIDLLRKDNWIFDGIKDKWRCPENGDGGYRHASKTLNRLCQKFQVKKINREL